MKRFPFFFFILLLLIGIAEAGEQCAETTFNDEIRVTNNQVQTLYYEVSASGKAGIFTKITSDTGFFLKPGESKTVTFNTYLPFTGDYDLKITLSDSKGVKINYAYLFNVVSCHGVNASIVGLESEYCINGRVNYTIILENTGIHEEEVSVNVGNNAFRITLMQGDRKSYDLTFFPESVKDNEINVLVQNNHFTFYNTTFLNLINCDHSTYSINELELCEGRYYEHEFFLKNTGLNPDNYTITTNSKAVTLLKNSTRLMPGEEESIRFALRTNCNDLGLKLTSIKVYSMLSSEMIIPVNYNVLNCYGQELIIHSNEFNDFCETDDKVFTATLKNTGTSMNTFTTFFRYNHDNITNNLTLHPGEERNITLEYNNISAGVISLLFSSISHDICSDKIELMEDLTVKPYSSCYSGALTVQDRFFDNNTKITVRNNGTRTNDYIVRILALNEIDNMSFSIPSSESITLLLQPLMQIHNDYGINEFMIVLEGKGVNQSGNTTFYNNAITGLITRTASSASLLIGITLLLVIVYAFIRNK